MAVFNYNRDIPDGPNNPSVDQPDMKINTNSIDDLLNEDHYSFNVANGGFHKQVHLPFLGIAPTTAALQGAVYTKNVGLGVTQLFYRRESNGSEIQITSGVGLTNVPTILSGTFTPGAVAAAITPALPQNVYGYILFYRQTGSFGHQIGVFSTDASKAYGMSMRVVTNGSANDDPVELINNPAAADLKLYGIRDDFASSLYNWRLHYWPI